MPLRDGHEFLRGHRGHPSARMSLSPDTKRGFSLGPTGVAHSFRNACHRMTGPRGHDSPLMFFVPAEDQRTSDRDRLCIYVSRSRRVHRVRRQGAEPNATFRVGADGETGDFKGLTLSNSSPVLLGSRGFLLGRGGETSAKRGMAGALLR
jgi:hypothetical protein